MLQNIQDKQRIFYAQKHNFWKACQRVRQFNKAPITEVWRALLPLLAESFIFRSSRESLKRARFAHSRKTHINKSQLQTVFRGEDWVPLLLCLVVGFSPAPPPASPSSLMVLPYSSPEMDGGNSSLKFHHVRSHLGFFATSAFYHLAQNMKLGSEGDFYICCLSYGRAR